jgi:hypothetical protein
MPHAGFAVDSQMVLVTQKSSPKSENVVCMTDRVHQREAEAENYPRTHRWSRSNRKPRNSPGSTAGAPLDFEGRGGTFKSRSVNRKLLRARCAGVWNGVRFHSRQP